MAVLGFGRLADWLACGRTAIVLDHFDSTFRGKHLHPIDLATFALDRLRLQYLTAGFPLGTTYGVGEAVTGRTTIPAVRAIIGMIRSLAVCCGTTALTQRRAAHREGENGNEAHGCEMQRHEKPWLRFAFGSKSRPCGMELMEVQRSIRPTGGQGQAHSVTIRA